MSRLLSFQRSIFSVLYLRLFLLLPARTHTVPTYVVNLIVSFLSVLLLRELSLSGGWKLLPRWYSGAPKTRGGNPQHCQVRRELGKTKGNIYLVLLLHPSSERLFKDWNSGLVCFQTALVLASVLLFSWFLDHKMI